jgi:hypothetical protein
MGEEERRPPTQVLGNGSIPMQANIPRLGKIERDTPQGGLPTMNPEKLARLNACLKEIAAILYEEAESKELTTLESIEKTVRQQILEQVSPKIALFLSSK